MRRPIATALLVPALILWALTLTALAPAPPAAAQGPEEQASTDRSGLREISTQDRAEAQAMLYAYKDDVRSLNDKIIESMAQMDTLFEAERLNESRIRALATEIMGLRSTLYKKTVEFRIEFHNRFGVLPF